MKHIDRLQQQLEIFIFFENRKINFPKMSNNAIYRDICEKFNIKLGKVLSLFETKNLQSVYLQLIKKETKVKKKVARKLKDSHLPFASTKFGSEQTMPKLRHKRTPTYYDDNNINVFEYLWDHK